MITQKGTYGKETVQSNSLVQNLLKYPEIASKIIRQYPQYSLQYFVDGLNRYAKEDVIGDVRFQWPTIGRLSRPSTMTGTFSGTGASLAPFTFEVEENYLNPNDVVRFADGTQAVILSEPVITSGGYTFTAKVQSPDTAFAGITTGTAFAAGTTVGKIGTAFPEGSNRGYQNHVYPDWNDNYLGIQRKSFEITGSALTDVTWVENNGQRLWFFTDEMFQREQFLYENEVSDWYDVRTVDSNGNPTLFGPDGKPIYKGDGLLRQISAVNIDTYGGTLTESQITDFLAQLSLNTGVKNSQWLVYTGTAGLVAFHNAMKNLLISGAGTLFYNAATGKEQALGVNFNTYAALGHKITLVHTPVFDDPNLHGNSIDPATGYPKESFRMVFLNFGVTDGISNIERKVKGAGGINRSMITKYIPGMVNPFDQAAMMAANPGDKFSVEYLRESCLVVRNDKSCGQLIYA
jgi:hypothetical protein